MSHDKGQVVPARSGNSPGRLDDMMGMEQQNTPTRIRTVLRTTGALVAVGALGLFGVACGDDEDTAATTATPTTDAAAAAPVIEGAWARNSPMMAGNGAAYMTITSPVADKLVGAKADPSIVAEVQIHEVVMVMPDDSMGSDTTMGMDMGSDTTMGMDMGSDDTMPSGEMTMQEVEFIDLPAGTAVELKPGGYHVMLIGLVNPLEIGQTIQITLIFENAGEITIDVPALEEAPSA